MLKLKQEELAAKAGIKRNVLQVLEAPDRAMPSWESLTKLREVLEISGLELVEADASRGEGVRWRKPSGRNWIGQLRHARVMLGITLEELAEKSEVNKYTILRIEGGGLKRIPEQAALRVRKTLATCGAIIVPESRDVGIEVHRAWPP
ncbi:helix-turn-helix domain-containing protein [Rhizobium gallicum]|uniref:helix-turn-helix domain-containing protein n=1 Tax=Rhizobium gallicum TaxID=56730 RepID=UPI00093EAAE5